MKSKLILATLLIPLLLAGCGNNDGQFSGNAKSVTHAVNRSKQAAQSQERSNSNLIDTKDYPKIDATIIKRALNKDQIATAKAQIANKQLEVSGTVQTIGKTSDNQKAVMLSNNSQSYLVYGEPYVFKNIKLHEQVKVYGSGLALMDSKKNSFGFNSAMLSTKTLLFNAKQVNK